MKTLLAVLVAGACAVAAPAYAADSNTQQDKMKACNTQAGTRRATTARRS